MYLATEFVARSVVPWLETILFLKLILKTFLVSKSQWMSLVLIKNYSEFSSKIPNRSRYDEFRSIFPVVSVYYSSHLLPSPALHSCIRVFVSLTVARSTFVCVCEFVQHSVDHYKIENRKKNIIKKKASGR